ncbi:flagellar hook-associated protein FlgL [Maridesulfovibrio zosterae]|uniref:flagellar hook-associated protein FlgL n=1 Tax=Maridesulfovibrio zosterae TaxID=82171 RepID=UPI00041CF347|nr:flagellar hook-associated protein FlgL [Maridesulfovibrio zosterae]
MRISTSQIYSQSISNVSQSLNYVTEVSNKSASQKKINTPSDDPAGMGNVVNLRSYDQTLEGYYNNSQLAGSLLGTADGLLVNASELMIFVLEQAEQGATGTYSNEQSQSMSENMMAYMDSLLAIANAKSGDDYIFSGEATDTSPYEYVPGVTVTGDSPAKSNFVSFSGELEDPIIVEFTSDGTIGTDAITYTYSLNGGSDWVTGSMAATDTDIDLGDVTVSMNAGTAVTARDNDAETGSQFVVRNSLSYTGADEAMAIDISESVDVDVNTVGSDVFGGVDAATGNAYSEPNLFESISDAVANLWIGNEDGVATSIATLRDGDELLNSINANIGSREQKADFIGTSLSYTRDRITDSISDEEDADSAALTVELSKAQYIYQAVLSSTSKVISMSILDYL